MKRIIQFNILEDSYMCYENNNPIFTILKSNLEFDVKKFYTAFYGENMDYEIELINKVENNREANYVFDCVKKIVDEISTNLKEKLENK